MSTQVEDLVLPSETESFIAQKKAETSKKSLSTPNGNVSHVTDAVKQKKYEKYIKGVKMVAWEVAGVIIGFIVLNLKVISLILIDIFRLIIPPQQKSLVGKLILVTGSGQNMGRELSLQLSSLGAILILWDINKTNNEETAEMIRTKGGEAYAFTCDISDQEAVADKAAKVRREVGNPEYVFNNAGTYEHKPFLSHSPQEIQRIVNVNLLGNLWVTREFLNYMIQHNSGHIVSISSLLGFIGRNNVVPYCASKFGVKGMTEALAEEMRLERRPGICITAVHPFLISNIEDVKPNLKFPWLFEILEPAEAASRIIKGVRRNQEEIFLPEKLKPLMVISKALPRKLRRLFGDYMEA